MNNDKFTVELIKRLSDLSITQKQYQDSLEVIQQIAIIKYHEEPYMLECVSRMVRNALKKSVNLG